MGLRLEGLRFKRQLAVFRVSVLVRRASGTCRYTYCNGFGGVQHWSRFAARSFNAHEEKPGDFDLTVDVFFFVLVAFCASLASAQGFGRRFLVQVLLPDLELHEGIVKAVFVMVNIGQPAIPMKPNKPI